MRACSSRRAAHLEQVGVDRDVAAQAVARREGVDRPVAQDHVGVGHPAQAEGGRRLHHHPVALGELRGAHPDPGGPHLRVEQGAAHPDHEGHGGQEQEEPADQPAGEQGVDGGGADGGGRGDPDQDAQPGAVGQDRQAPGRSRTAPIERLR